MIAKESTTKRIFKEAFRRAGEHESVPDELVLPMAVIITVVRSSVSRKSMMRAAGIDNPAGDDLLARAFARLREDARFHAAFHHLRASIR